MPSPESEQSSRPTPAEQLIQVGERAFAGCASIARSITSRRGMPIAVAGGIVFGLAWLGERDSAWGFPMLITGLVMVFVGMMGPRISGSLDLRWGDDGTFFQVTSTIAPPGERRRAPASAALEESGTGSHVKSPAAPTQLEQPEKPEKLIPPSEIEGIAETMEFRVEAVSDAYDAVEAIGPITRAAGSGRS